MGKLFVIDGTDGSGKQTQFNKLQEKLKEEGIDYKVVSFPNYESPSSSLVKMYLSGEFGKNAKEISPYIASTFYAADRYATFQTGYKEYYEKGGIILADRYTTANMVHQAGKIKDKEERKKFLNWLWDFEFNLYGLPIPSEVFFLNMPVEKSLELMANRENKFTHEAKKDIHESDKNHLIDAYSAACDVAKEYNWYEIKCVKDNKIRTIEDIHEEIYNEIKKMKLIKNDRLECQIADVAEVAGYLWQRGWAERNGGNISVNVTDLLTDEEKALPAISERYPLPKVMNALKGNSFLVTGTNRRMRYVASYPMENMAVIRISDTGDWYEIIADNPVRPTSELPSHLSMHDYLKGRGVDNKVVLHTHPTDLVAMTHNRAFLQPDVLGKLLWSMIPETRVIVPKGLGIVPYKLPGSLELADATIRLLDRYDVVMWEKHGALAVGSDVIECFDMIDTLSKSAQIYLQARAMGFEPEGLTDEQSEELRKAFRLV